MLQVIGPVPTVEDLINDPNFNPDLYEGFVYLTVDLINNKEYIGKKNFRSSQNKKLGKKEIAALPVARGRTPTKKKVVKETDWKTYYGSNSTIKELVKKNGPENFKRYVLELCSTKKSLSYQETKYLFKYNVLESDKYYNDNILGKFYRSDFK